MPDDPKFSAEGGCACGEVRYRMERRPLFVNCCHCRWCQRESGAAFALNAMVESENITLLGAPPEVVDTPSNSGKGQQIMRCPQCQVALWSHYRTAKEALSFIRVGTLDDPDQLPPDIHIYTESKQPWVVLEAHIPAVEQYYDRRDYWSPDSLERWRALFESGVGAR